jgi:hypothetical protein
VRHLDQYPAEHYTPQSVDRVIATAIR